jgi:hypothetical protein
MARHERKSKSLAVNHGQYGESQWKKAGQTTVSAAPKFLVGIFLVATPQHQQCPRNLSAFGAPRSPALL